MSLKQKSITILGSTGSIGVQTLKVLSESSEKHRIAFLTVNKNIDLLFQQIKVFNPIGVAISDEKACKEFKKKYSFNGKILCGKSGIIEAASDSINDIVLSALVGFSGVEPTLAAIRQGTTIALANKETLVSAGALITKEANKNNVQIIAVDSEHNAILQCLVGESLSEIERIILTASGGPFFKSDINDLENITVEQALNHPNWSMGNKITIDSATMMNKGFEVIEAHWLFGIDGNKIDVLIHPQSIIHSLVEFIDGSVKAQLGVPDMRIPISYALTYPKRLRYNFPRLNLSEIQELNFYPPDYIKFPCLKLAIDSLFEKDTTPTIINAANEVAVNAFLNNNIKFIDISSVITEALNYIEAIDKPDLDEIIEIDLKTREFSYKIIKNKFLK